MDKLTKWIGGEHTFALNLGQIEALQKATDCGLELTGQRLVSGDWRARELLEIVRQGLLGAGVDGKEANDLTYGLHERGYGLDHFKIPAMATIEAALFSDPTDIVGEPAATTEPPQPTPSENGNSAESTGPEQP